MLDVQDETFSKLSPQPLNTNHYSYCNMKKRYIALIVLVLFVLLYWWSRPAQYSPITQDGDHVRGEGIEVIEFSDFECPACQRVYSEVEEAFRNASVKFIYKHFPLTQIHPRAMSAAEASECAADQGKFWEYHELLFLTKRLAYEDLIAHAKKLDLDVEKFRVCIKSSVMRSRVLADQQEGVARGVRATPTFFINGKRYEGVLVADKLRSLVGVKS